MDWWATIAYAPVPVRAMVSRCGAHIRWPSRGARDLHYLAFFQIPLFPERRIMADDGLYIEELLRSRAARWDRISDLSRSPALPRRL
jgi:hypothetical protein